MSDQPTTALALPGLNLTAEELNGLDVDKLHSLYSLAERQQDRAAEQEFSAAIVRFQDKCPKIEKTDSIEVNGKTRSTYAPWDKINDVVGPLLADQGLALSFGAPIIADGVVRLTGTLRHSGGHKEVEECQMPVDPSLRANESQKAGSAISYAKRYLAGAILNLSFGNEDDNGEAAGTETINSEQQDEILELVDQIAEQRRGGFWSWIGVESVDQMPASMFKKAKSTLQKIIRES